MKFMAYPHIDSPNDGTVLSLISSSISLGVYLSTVMHFNILSILTHNIYTFQFPLWIPQSIAMTAGIVSIIAGLVSLRKKLKKDD
jgi:hypothetical protein